MRESMNVVPERLGHAAGDPVDGAAAGPSNAVVANPKTEMYITLGAQDTLSSVAKAYGVSLEWLIKRNRLSKPVAAGDNLIVPKAR
jgi:LysM repeat protein